VPELPDITAYIHALRDRTVGQTLLRVRVASPFLLRTFDPPLSAVDGQRVLDVSRLGKRIVFELEHELFLVLHLMIAGRLHWKEAAAKLPRKLGLCAFDFAHGTLLLTEASKERRASLHVVRGRTGLGSLDPGGLEVLDASFEAFDAAIRRENHTVKRTLSDPRILSGIGNAYSDEILHRARMSPIKHTNKLTDAKRVRFLTRAALCSTNGHARWSKKRSSASPSA